MSGRAGRAAWICVFLLGVGCHDAGTTGDGATHNDQEGNHVVPDVGGPPTNTGPVDDGGTVLPRPDGGSTDGGSHEPPLPIPDGGISFTGFRTPAANPIPAENARPGTVGWFDGRQANDGQVELYTSIDSVERGQSFTVKVSTDTVQHVSAEILRLGDYGGAGARRVWAGGPFNTDKQSFCPRDATTSRVECHWTDTFPVTVGDDWVSGVYLVKVTRPDNFRRFAAFVVRDHRAADLLYQPAFNTYQAYDSWGGESLYADYSGTMPFAMATEVSYDRPLKGGDGTGYLLTQELALIQLIEHEGYDVTYGTNLDFSRFPNFLDGIGAFVNGGHDEYWTAEERAQLDAAVDSGHTSVAYFGANGGYWRVRATPDAAGTPLRTVACFKLDTRDPVPNSTIRFRDDPNAHPENGLWGSQYENWMLVGFPLVVKNPSHWLFAGTGLSAGTRLNGLLGFEFDRTMDNGHQPVVDVAMESPVVSAEAQPSMSQAVSRVTPAGTIVFSAGSIYWSLGLYRGTELYDARVERMTLNVLERAVAHRRAMRTLPAVSGPTQTEAAPIGCWARSVEPVAGNGWAGQADGPGAQAQFAGPTGLAVTATGKIVLTDTGANRIRLIDTDPSHTVTTLAGNGLLGGRDGAGAQAMFRSPSGIAVGPDGAYYVADSDNHSIRRVDPNPPYNVTTFAGALRKRGDGDGPLTVARFNRPTALALGPDGRLYVADQAGNKIRMIDFAAGTVVTIAGNTGGGFIDSSFGSSARFNNPSAIAVAPTGEIYVYDAGNQRLRRISADANHAVTTIAGDLTNPAGFLDGTGDKARFRAQMGLTVSASGEVILADTANFRLRRIIPGADMASTQVCTMAGTGRVGTQLGRADVADVVAPTGLAFGPTGLLYVSDSFNSSIRALTR